MAKRERMESIKIQIPAGEMQIYRQLAKEYNMSIAAVFRAVTNGKLAQYLGTVRYIDPEQAKEIRSILMNFGTKMDKSRLEINRIGVNLNQLTEIAWSHGIKEFETIQEARDTVLNALAKYDLLAEQIGGEICHIQA